MGRHILFLTHYFPPEVNAPASRTYEHAKRWVKKGVRVTVITNNPNHPLGKLFPGYTNRFLSREAIDGINVIRVKTFLIPHIGISKRAANYLFFAFMAIVASFFVRNFDVVLATSPQIFCGIAGSLISKAKRKPFVLEIRDLWPGQVVALNVIKSRLLLGIMERLEKFLYRAADGIVTTTGFQRTYILMMAHPNRVTTIPNAADLELFRSVSSNSIQDHPLAGKFVASYIGFFGMLYALYIILDTAKAVESYKDIHFLLVGDGANKNVVQERCEELGLKNVTLMPFQSRSEIVRLISISDVGLLILKGDQLFETSVPAKMFEYLAMKRPVIFATRKGEGSKLVEKHDCGLVIEPEDSTKLKEAILKLYSDSNLRKKLGLNGYRAVQQYYNRDIMADMMLDAIFT
ncbi:MAG: glycosyltransferase family 4 protein [Candidatus Neomarinimicrobiota bacterium]